MLGDSVETLKESLEEGGRMCIKMIHGSGENNINSLSGKKTFID